MNEASADGADGRGFRPSSRRRTRIAAGIAIAAIAVAGNVLVYASLDDSIEVVQFTDNVYAGEQVSSSDVRVIEIDGDIPTANLVPADQLGAVVSQYARTFIPSGSLASTFVVQATPLVSPGTAVVAIEPTGGGVPDGLLERSRVRLVLSETPELLQVDGRVVAVDRDDEDGPATLSVEVADVDAGAVAAAEEVRVVLLDPGVDPAVASETGGDG
jgi:hypothetical protein